MAKSKQPKYEHSKTLEALDDYMSALFAVIAFTNEARWDPSKRRLKSTVQFEFGRRMTTSVANKISPSIDVTPDCVLQVSTSHGYISEAKLGLPKDQTLWDDDVRQLAKYDDNLSGWWTPDETVAGHDVVALVPLLRAVRFADVIKEGEANDRWKFSRNLLVVGFERQIGPDKTWLILKKEGGTISPEDLQQRLRLGVKVQVEILVSLYGDRKFLDHSPPLPVILQILWDDLFTQYASAAGMGGDAKPIDFDITVQKVTSDLQKFYGFSSSGARSPEIPRQAWIRQALDALVDFSMAETKPDSTYLIRYRRQRGDMLERFGRLCHLRQRKAKPIAPTNQATLGFEGTAPPQNPEGATS